MKRLFIFVFLSSSLTILADESNLFKLREGEKISFDTLIFTETSNFKPFGPAYTIVEPTEIFDRSLNSNRIMDDYKLCELSSLNVFEDLMITPSMIFTAKNGRPDSSAIRHITFYNLTQDRGSLQLRLVCRAGVKHQVVVDKFKMIFHRN